MAGKKAKAKAKGGKGGKGKGGGGSSGRRDKAAAPIYTLGTTGSLRRRSVTPSECHGHLGAVKPICFNRVDGCATASAIPLPILGKIYPDASRAARHRTSCPAQ